MIIVIDILAGIGALVACCVAWYVITAIVILVRWGR